MYFLYDFSGIKTYSQLGSQKQHWPQNYDLCSVTKHVQQRNSLLLNNSET